MAIISVNEIIDDIELQLNQGTISDDSELSRDQVAYWLEVEANFMIRQECDAAIKAGKQINPIYIVRTSGLLSREDPFTKVASLNAVGDPPPSHIYTLDTSKFYRLSYNDEYVEMTDREVSKYSSRFQYGLLVNNILDLYNDAGVIRVMTDDYEMVNKSSTETIEMMEHLRFAGPTKNIPVYRRVANTIYIEGMTMSRLMEKEFIVDYVAYQSATGSMKIGDVILPSVIDRVLQRAKLQMYGSSQDMANDGEDYKQSMYHTAIQNPAKGESTPQ